MKILSQIIEVKIPRKKSLKMIDGRKIEIWVKNVHFGQKSKSWLKSEIDIKNRNFGQESKLWSKIELLSKILKMSARDLQSWKHLRFFLKFYKKNGRLTTLLLNFLLIKL